MLRPVRTALASLDDVVIVTPEAGQVIKYDGTTGTWINAAPTGAGGGTPGGADGSVQFNDAGSFGGFGAWDPVAHTLTLAYAGGIEIQLQTTDSAGETAVRFQNVASGKHHYLRHLNGALMIQAEGGGNVRRAIVVADGGHVSFGNYNRVSTAGATFSPPAANPGAQPIAVRGDGSNDYLVTLHGNGDTQIGGIRADASWDLPELADASAVNDSVYYSTDQSAPAYKDSAGTVHSLIAGAGGGATTLDGLSDVTLTTPAAGDHLRYDGAGWVNSPIPAADLPDLSGTYATVGSLSGHTSNTANPHAVTAAQVGTYTTSQIDTALAAKAPLAAPVFTGRATIPAHVGPITTDTDGATITFDLSVSDWHRVTLGGNRTLALANAAIGQQFTLMLEQDATGTRTVTWFAGIRWAGGTPPTLTTTAGKADVFTFKCIGTGEYLGFVAGADL